MTNLLIERTGARVGVLTTRGFRDVLEIQHSYRIRSLDISSEKTPPLVPRRLRLEVGGRTASDGTELEPISADEVRAAVAELLEEGVESLAIALYNAYASPAHEHAVAAIVEQAAPGLPVTVSSDVDRRVGEYERVSTCALNAAAVPQMRRYVDDLDSAVEAPIQYMHSAAGVMPAAEANIRPIQLAFSGPAAGVLAAREVARQLGYENAITLDMGGTSCDVSLIWDGQLRFRTHSEVGWGITARLESLDVHTVGAGGGSICWLDAGGALRVGPQSAGSVPGPACYGRGGEAPTVTDANLVLGIVSPAGLLGGELGLNTDAAHAAFHNLAEQFDVDAETLARGAHTIVSANMAQAIREITVRRGLGPASVRAHRFRRCRRAACGDRCTGARDHDRRHPVALQRAFGCRPAHRRPSDHVRTDDPHAARGNHTPNAGAGLRDARSRRARPPGQRPVPRERCARALAGIALRWSAP